MNKEPIVHVSNLCFGFSSHEEVFHDVSFTLEEKSFMGLVGPNGSGKSTLLKLLLGELKPRHGKIAIQDGVRISYVPQSLSFDKNFPITALEVVLGGLYSTKNDPKEKEHLARRALHEMGMEKLAHIPFGKLSGGQAQRVLIARAIVREPTLLLLDEPTTSVDTQAQAAILQYLISQKHKITILMVTHDLRTVLSHVDGLICLQGGAAYMKPKEVCEHFALGLYHEPLMNTPHHHFEKQG